MPVLTRHSYRYRLALPEIVLVVDPYHQKQHFDSRIPIHPHLRFDSVGGYLRPGQRSQTRTACQSGMNSEIGQVVATRILSFA